MSDKYKTKKIDNEDCDYSNKIFPNRENTNIMENNQVDENDIKFDNTNNNKMNSNIENENNSIDNNNNYDYNHNFNNSENDFNENENNHNFNSLEISVNEKEKEENQPQPAENPSNSTEVKIPCYKEKKFKKIIIAIASILAAIIIIVLCVVLIKKNKKKVDEDDSSDDINLPIINGTIEYSISSLIFDSVKEEKVEINFDRNSFKKRILDSIETIKTKTIKSKYLFIISNSESNKFSGYLIMLSREDETSENNFNDEGKENFHAATKISFNENGEIFENNFLIGTNEIYKNEINDTLLGLIPKIKNSYRNLEQIELAQTEDDFNNTIYEQKITGRIAIDNDALKNSKFYSNIISKTKFKRVENSVIKKELNILNGEYDNNNNDSNVEFKDLSTIKSLFQSILINSEQNINLIETQNEKKTKEYEEKLEKFVFSGTNSKNSLRILTENEYEKQMKILKEIENKYKLRNSALVGEVTSSLEFPLTFKYEIFKTNILGIEFALRTSVEWIPKMGYASFNLIFQRGTKEYKLDNQYISIGNYSNIVKSYKNILMTIISEFEVNILDQFEGSYKNLSDNIKENLTESLEMISSITNKLKNLSDYFKDDFVEFKKNVLLNYSFSYVNLNKFINDFGIFITNISDQIDESKKNHILNVDLNPPKIYSDFFDQFSEFITKTNKSNNFSFDFYYKIKEIFDKVNYFRKNIKNITDNIIENDYLRIENSINEEFNMQKINEIEIILDIFKNNEILNASSEFINNLELVNKNYTNYKEIILSNLKRFLFKNKNLYFNSTENEENSLISKIENKLSISKSNLKMYEISNDFIIKFNNLENEIFQIKLNAFQTEINNKLNEITIENFFTNEFNVISNEINEEINLIKKNLNEEKEINTNFEKIIKKFDDLIKKKDEFKLNIENNFNSNYLNSLIQNYYSNYFNKLNSTLLKFFNEINVSIYKPVEIINKLKKNETENINYFNNKLNYFVKNKIKNLLFSICSKINNFIQNESNKIKININYLKSENQIKNVVDQFSKIKSINLNDLNNEIINLKFNVYSTIEFWENSTISLFNSFADDLSKKFQTNHKEKYFQILKMRNFLNSSNNIQSFINKIISKENLIFSSENFTNLFKNSENFNENSINSQIQNLLFSLNQNSLKNIEQTNIINKIKVQIKESFPLKYDLIDRIFTSIFKAFHDIPKNLEEELDKLFIEAKAIAKIGKDNDCNNLKNMNFFFNSSSTSLEAIFNETLQNYIRKLEVKQKKILDDLKLSDNFVENIFNEIKEKLFDDLNNYRNELIINMTAQAPKNCFLLNNNISYTSIVNSSINELINEINNEKKETLLQKFEDPLKEYKKVYQAYFDKFNVDFANQYRFFFDSYRNVLTQHTSSTQNDNEITNLTELIREGFEDGLNLCLNNFGVILNTENFTKSIDTNNNITKIIFNIFHDIQLENPNLNYKIEDDIKNLTNFCENELINEKKEFNNQIFNYIQNGFNESVKRFLNGNGKNYLDKIFENNYDILIDLKLDFIQKKSLNLKDYLNYIINESNEKDFYFLSSTDDVYYQLMNNLNDGINQNKINEIIIKKINEFKNDSAEKIIEYFNNNLPINSSFLNEVLLQILPKKIPYEIQLKLKQNYYDLFNKHYLNDKINLYNNDLLNKLQTTLNNINNYRIENRNKIGIFNEPSSTINLTDFNNLNASYYNIINNFSFVLINSNLNNNETIIEYFDKIINEFYNEYKKVQKNIENNLNINIKSDEFNKFINELDKKTNNDSNYDELIKDLFIKTFNDSLKSLKENVFKSYGEQSGPGTDLLDISENKNRRLEETNQTEEKIEIEEIQVLANQLEIKILTFNQNKTIKDTIADLKNKLNLIEKLIQNHLINFDGYLENQLNFVYLNNTEKLTNLRNQLIEIKNNINEKLTNLFKKEINKINKILISLNNFKFLYNDDIKPRLIQIIYEITEYASKILISKYLTNNGEQNEIKYSNLMERNNLGEIDSFIGSTNIKYTTFIQSSILKWGYKFITNPNNFEVYLNIFGGGSAQTNISLLIENYNSTIKGELGIGMIGMNLTNDFRKSKVLANYYTIYNDTIYSKELYDVYTIDSLDACDEDKNCFVSENNDYCPYIIDVVTNSTVNIEKSRNRNYYKDTKISVFTQKYQNKLCTYANYLYGIEEVQFSFNSSLNRTL